MVDVVEAQCNAAASLALSLVWTYDDTYLLKWGILCRSLSCYAAMQREVDDVSGWIGSTLIGAKCDLGWVQL